jgi:hypothetical protein
MAPYQGLPMKSQQKDEDLNETIFKVIRPTENFRLESRQPITLKTASPGLRLSSAAIGD